MTTHHDIDPNAVCVLLERQRLVNGHPPHPADSPQAQALRRAVDALSISADPVLRHVADLGRQLLPPLGTRADAKELP